MKKRTFVLLMAVVMVFTCFGSCFAEGANKYNSMRYSYIARISGSISSTGSAVSFKGVGKSTSSDTVTEVRVTLRKRLQGGTNWSSAGTYYGNASGTNSCTVIDSAATQSGYEYSIYVQCTIRAADGTILEVGGTSSNTVYIP